MRLLCQILLFVLPLLAHASFQSWQLSSPSGENEVTIAIATNKELGGGTPYVERERLYYKVVHRSFLVLPWSPLGVIGGPEDRDDNSNFVDGLEFVRANPVKEIRDSYYIPHGKRRNETVAANMLTLQFENEHKRPIHVIFKAFDDGVAFSYFFPGERGENYKIEGEETGFYMLKSVKAWMQEYDRPGPVSPAYENLFQEVKPGAVSHLDGWCFPALFEIPLSTTRSYYLLLAEGGVTRDYVGTRLEGQPSKKLYKVRFPSAHEAKGIGETYAVAQTPFYSSWHVIIIGDAKAIVESNLVNHVSAPLDPKFRAGLDWVVGGSAAWSWWSQAVGTPSLQREYIDSASEYGWRYVLVDANWDRDWENHEEEVQDLVKYGKSKYPPVGIWLWYNSGGPHNDITESPRDKMDVASVRRKEFERISSWGVKGVKVDFWHSDKQDRMQQYLDVLADAADYRLMVNFHGSTMPRGWSRQYPNLVSMESVRGAETYKGLAINPGPKDNVLYAYTRNVVGPMDYTPLTFYAAWNIHRLSFAHSLALSVVFECGVQHWADRADSDPNQGYRKLFSDFPFAREFLRELPTVWDDTVFISGQPHTHVSLARRNGRDWWIASISGSGKFPTTFNYVLHFMGDYNLYEYQQIGEGVSARPEGLVESRGTYNSLTNGSFYVRVLPLSGFVAHFKFIKELPGQNSNNNRPSIGNGIDKDRASMRLSSSSSSSSSWMTLWGDSGSGVTVKLLLLFLAVAVLVYFSKEERRRRLRRTWFEKKIF